MDAAHPTEEGGKRHLPSLTLLHGEWVVIFQGTGTASETDIDTQHKKGPGEQIMKQRTKEGGAKRNAHPLGLMKMRHPGLDLLSCPPPHEPALGKKLPPPPGGQVVALDCMYRPTRGRRPSSTQKMPNFLAVFHGLRPPLDTLNRTVRVLF